MTDKKIELASQDSVHRLESYIDQVIGALGHPEALVTDESMVSDFLCVVDQDEAAKELSDASESLGLVLKRKDYIIDVAERLKNG